MTIALQQEVYYVRRCNLLMLLFTIIIYAHKMRIKQKRPWTRTMSIEKYFGAVYDSFIKSNNWEII